MCRQRKVSVAIIHPRLNRGGSETAVMWMAEALKRDFAVSIVTGGPVELDNFNRFCGTALETGEVTIRRLAIPFVFACLSGADALRGAFFQRAIRSIVADYDVLISAYNVCDFGVPAIHRIADFSWNDELRWTFDPLPGGLRGLFHSVAWLRAAYLGLTDRVAFPSGHRPLSGENLIVANSEWTAAKLREKYGIVAEVVYPPVVVESLDVPHERRRNDFVCINRISPEKRIDRMIQIIGAVRNRGHDVRIRIIGSLDSSPYSRTIASLARQHPEWVLLEGGCVGEKKARIMADCRYGIHGREGEAFGIGVAEMAKAGCITFVPAEGGPAEIVGYNPALVYDTPDEAVEKIDSMLRNPGIESAVRAFIELRAEVFGRIVHARHPPRRRRVCHIPDPTASRVGQYVRHFEAGAG
jgi:glycosyltransferase involved in cell wall biosynthesis